MEATLSAAIVGGLGGMLGWGFADFFAKKTIDKIGDLQSLVLAHICGTAAFLILALYTYGITGHFIMLPRGAGNYLWLLFFGVLQMIVYWLVYIGFGKGQLAVLNPIFASYSGIVALISIVFLSEALKWGTGLSLVIIFLGIILMNSDFHGLKTRSMKILPGVKEVAAAAVLAAIWTLLWGRFVRGHDYLAYALFMYFFMSLAAISAALVKKVNILPVPASIWRLVALIGLGEAVAYLSISYGFGRSSHTSVVALLSGSFSLPTVVLARLFLKERISRGQVIAVIMIVAGVILLAAAS